METEKTSPPLPAALDSHIGYRLRRVSNAVSGAFSRALQEKHTSVAEWVLLRELYDRGQAVPNELADTLGLTRGAVSKIVDKLETKRWVRSDAGKTDNRFRPLSLTSAGKRSVPALAKIADGNDAHFFDCLTARERALLLELLAKIADHHRLQDVPTE